MRLKLELGDSESDGHSICHDIDMNLESRVLINSVSNIDTDRFRRCTRARTKMARMHEIWRNYTIHRLQIKNIQQVLWLRPTWINDKRDTSGRGFDPRSLQSFLLD